MIEELEAIKKSKTYELKYYHKLNILLMLIVNVKWVFKVKFTPYKTIAKHKARLVAKKILQK